MRTVTFLVADKKLDYNITLFPALPTSPTDAADVYTEYPIPPDTIHRYLLSPHGQLQL
jgi:hypothetical protein